VTTKHLVALKPDPLTLPPEVYNSNVSGPDHDDSGGVLSQDTPAAIERLQIERWRRMSSVEKVALVSAASRAVRELAEAGIRERHPDATDDERFLRLAILTLGPDLACAAYPDAAGILSPNT
jgi:hypothetical protein